MDEVTYSALVAAHARRIRRHSWQIPTRGFTTVAGRNPANQLRLVVYTIIWYYLSTRFYIYQVVSRISSIFPKARGLGCGEACGVRHGHGQAPTHCGSGYPDTYAAGRNEPGRHGMMLKKHQFLRVTFWPDCTLVNLGAFQHVSSKPSNSKCFVQQQQGWEAVHSNLKVLDSGGRSDCEHDSVFFFNQHMVGFEWY